MNELKEAFPLKYWTGYLTAAIIGAISWALLQLGERFTDLVDMIYPYLTRTLMDILAAWTAPLPFCLWQVVVLAAAVAAILIVILVIVFRRSPIRWIGWMLSVVSLVYLLHTLVFGLNYHAGSIAEDIRMEQRDYTVTELAAATTYYRDMANLLSDQVKRDANGNVAFADFETLAEMAGDGFDALVHDYSFPIFAGSTLPVKKLGWSGMYSSMGITGVTMGLTGEAAVNPQIPATSLPFTMCHEMAHRMSIATERDANFAGFLACMANPNIQFRYSAYFMAYRYCYSALVAVNTMESAGAAARISSGLTEEMVHDMNVYNTFFQAKRNETATRVADTANDTYLKASGNTEGIASYGQVSGLLVNWHYQQIILPTIVKEELPFDPFDESQVDLSGNVNANIPEPTEPAEEGGVG